MKPRSKGEKAGGWVLTGFFAIVYGIVLIPLWTMGAPK